MLTFAFARMKFTIYLLMVVLHHAEMTSSEDATIPLYIGAFIVESGPMMIWSGGISQAVELAVRHINNQTDMLPGYHLELVVKDTAGDAGLAMRYLIDMIQSPPQKIMLIGPGRSESCIATAETAKWWNLLQIAVTCTWPVLSDRSRFPFFHRIPMPETVFTPLRVAFLKHFGWSRAAIMYREDTSFNAAAKMLATEMSDNNITIATMEIFADEAEPDQAIRKILETDARIIFSFNYDAPTHFCKAYRSGLYGPRYVWMSLYRSLRLYSGLYWWEDASGTDCTPEEIHTAAQGNIMFNQAWIRDDDTVTVSGRTSQEFIAEYNQLLTPGAAGFTTYGPYGYDAMWSLALVLNGSIGNLPNNKTLHNFTYDDSDVLEEFLKQFRKLDFEGVSGPVMFEEGNRIGRVDIWQFTGNEHYRRGSYYHETADFSWESDFVWPGGETPKDRGMVEKRTLHLNKTVVYVACIFVACGIILSLGFLTFNIMHRDKRYIKMSSPNLNNSIVGGAILVYFAVIFLGGDGLFPSLPVTAVCQTKTWLLCLGFTLGFGSMFSKTWRVHKIFTNKKVKTLKIRDLHLFGIVLIMLAIDSAILLLWTLIDPPRLHITEYLAEPDTEGRDLMIIPMAEECKSKQDVIWMTILLGYKGIVLVFGVFLSWETRKVKYAQLNDSRYIGFAVYNVTILCCVGVPTSMFLNPRQKDLQFILGSLCMIFCTTLTLCIVFVPKILEHRDSQRSVDDHPRNVLTGSQHTTEQTISTLATGYVHSSGSCKKAEEELIRFRQMFKDNRGNTE
ncbi:gamma-aminobutyric acid type B receptor subunit 2-like [Ptychodera flava]|uniref:gamma-aminobutyric acid type B receptor subunit 2-like n=1 Tax=Ptychodera flava TaxID=63121 RepID=UPI003969E49E